MDGKDLVNDTFAKQQLGVKLNETKMLGLSWKNEKYFLAVKYHRKSKLLELASIYNSLGIISLSTIIRKMAYCDICYSEIL